MTTVLRCLWKLRYKFIGRTLPKFTQNSPPNYTCSSFIQIWYVSVPGISRLQLRAIRLPFLVKSKHCNPTPGQKERNTSWELSPRSGLLEEGWGCGEGTPQPVGLRGKGPAAEDESSPTMNTEALSRHICPRTRPILAFSSSQKVNRFSWFVHWISSTSKYEGLQYSESCAKTWKGNVMEILL